MSIYTHNTLKYPLTNDEYHQIDSVWKFVTIFTKPFLFLSDQRTYIIQKINESYSLEQFYLLECILNKLFWNLRHKLVPLWLGEKNKQLDDIPNTLTSCIKIQCKSKDDIKHHIRNYKLQNNYYRSFINKLVIIDRDVVYFKKMEGSSGIFHQNNFNLTTITVLLDRQLYEAVMLNPNDAMNINLAKFYHQGDYLFPNLNFCVYQFGSSEERKERIKKMYYSEDIKYWFKIIDYHKYKKVEL